MSKMQTEDIKLLKSTSEAAFVLRDHSPDDVVKAIIQSDQQKESFYTFDMDMAYQYIQLFKERMPRVKIYYALKANDYVMMLKLAVAAGLGFDCASPGEIYKILQLNVCPISIIYASPAKTPDQMIYARQAGVRHTTFDSSCELKKMKQYWQDSRLLIRIHVEGDSVYKLGEKFGCDFETEANDLLDEAANLGLRVIGVAFHVGSGCSSPCSYVTGLQQAKALFQREEQKGRIMKIVDIGGGFVCHEPDKFEMGCRIINSTLEELFPDTNVQIIAEPGRFLSEPAFSLYTNINSVSEIKTGNKLYKTVYITESLQRSYIFLEKWHRVEIYSNSLVTDEELEDTILYGATSDNCNRIINVKLPKCSVQNWLMIQRIGSYSISMETSFNSFEAVKIRSLISLELWEKLKLNSVFEKSDFIHNPNISTPLPSRIPPVIPPSTEDQDYHGTKTLI